MPMSMNFPAPAEQFVLLKGSVPQDFEIVYGGQYVSIVRPYKGGAFGTTTTVQLQVYTGPEESDPTDPAYAGEWQNAGAAVAAVQTAGTAISLGYRSRVRVVLAGAAPTGNGLFVSLKRIPQ